MGGAPPDIAAATRASATMPAAFRFRKGTPADLAHCLELLPAGFQPSRQVRRRLPGVWNELVAREAHTFAIIEDFERPYPERIESFGLSMFVSDEFVAQFTASPRPQLAAFAYEQMLAGEHVMLTGDELARANSTAGLNVIVLHFGMRNHDLAHPRSAQALSAGSAAFYFFHAGYRIKLLINEVFGAQAARFMEAGGFRRIRDFRQDAPETFSGMAPEFYPYLFMLRREWIEPGSVNVLSQLFYPSPPRIGFSRAEQRVLEHALLNEPDAAIAAALRISSDAVKKTWRNIFARVRSHAAYLIPDDGWNGSRGQEKRRHLLDYLRLHLEELRPISRPAANGKNFLPPK